MLAVLALLSTDADIATTGLLAVAAAGLLGGFLLPQARTDALLLPLRLLTSRPVGLGNLVQVLMVAGLFGYQLLGVLYLQQLLGYDPLQAGLAYLPVSLIIAAVSPGLSARLDTRFGTRTVLITGLALITAGLALLTRLPASGAYFSDILPAGLLIAAGFGLAFPALAAAVDLALRCSGARLLRGDDTAGRLAHAFGAAGRWRDASDLSLDCLTGPPGRELLGRLLDVGVLMADREPSEPDARHIAANLVELARRQHPAGENPGAACYSAGNWLFHTVRDYSAALRAYEAAAEARPDYRTQDYWLQETAAALFETGDYVAGAAMYRQARAAATGPAPGLLGRTVDCLAHAGDTEQALLLLERYQRYEPHPEAPWILKLLALRQLNGAVGTDGTTVEEPAVRAEQHANEDAEGAEEPWHDWPSLVHPGLGVAEDLERMNRAAARGDAAAFLAVLTAGCAFPAPDEPEPWAALLLLAWALGQSYSADWSLPGDVLDAALNTAVHRRGDALLRDLLACSPRSRSGSRRQPFGTGGCWSARSTTTADGKP